MKGKNLQILISWSIREVWASENETKEFDQVISGHLWWKKVHFFRLGEHFLHFAKKLFVHLKIVQVAKCWQISLIVWRHSVFLHLPFWINNITLNRNVLAKFLMIIAVHSFSFENSVLNIKPSQAALSYGISWDAVIIENFFFSYTKLKYSIMLWVFFWILKR